MNILLQHRFFLLLFFFFFFFLFAGGRLASFVHLLLFPFWVVFDHLIDVCKILLDNVLKPMEWQSSSLILFLLCFFGCDFPHCCPSSCVAVTILLCLLLPLQVVVFTYFFSCTAVMIDGWIRNNTLQCTEPNSSLLLLCKFCTLPRLFLLVHLCCHCHGRRSLSSIKQPRLLIYCIAMVLDS